MGKITAVIHKCFFQASLLDHHEKLGNAGNEEGDGDQAHEDLVRTELSLLGHDVEACCSVVPSEEPDDEGLGRFGREGPGNG